MALRVFNGVAAIPTAPNSDAIILPIFANIFLSLFSFTHTADVRGIILKDSIQLRIVQLSIKNDRRDNYAYKRGGFLISIGCFQTIKPLQKTLLLYSLEEFLK